MWQTSPGAGFAVVDTETTGLTSRDRVLEIAVVRMSPYGQIEDVHDTLVNPRRDVGPQHIHRISAGSLLGAPDFPRVAPPLADLLAGRVLVGHNLDFDAQCLVREYGRMGLSVPLSARFGLDTMELATVLGGHRGRASLAECCRSAGIELTGAHRARADAVATARLLAVLLAEHPGWPGWAFALAGAAALPWPVVPLGAAPAATPWYDRETAAHDVALRRRDRPAPRHDIVLRPGDHVAFTGEMDRPREFYEAQAARAGLVPHPAVTRRVRLLVAADPDSLSGKARRARDYGIPIVGPARFLALADAAVLAVSAPSRPS